jgi:hypothetical protein
MPSINAGIPKQTSQKKGLNFDLIWQIIAAGLLLSVVLFYFGGLQPLILSKYIANLKGQVSRLESRLAEQTQSFSEIELTILQKVTTFNPTETCSTSQVVDTADSDFTALAEFKTSLLPEQKFAVAPRYSMFYLQKAETSYLNLYDKYEFVLTQYNTVYKNSLNLKTLLEYRNFWISNCQKIQDTKGKIVGLKLACEGQNQMYTEFISSKTYPEAVGLVSQSQAKCKEVLDFVDKPIYKGIYPNFNKWYSEWYTGFQNIMSYNTVFIPGISELSGFTDNFKQDIDKTYDELTAIEESKSDFFNKFYLVDF